MKRKHTFFIVAGLLGTLITTSCSNEELGNNSQDKNIPEGYETVISNDKFTCYRPSKGTRTDAPVNEIIKVSNLPDYTILFSENQDENKDAYKNFSKFIKDGNVVGEVYTNVEETEGGWIIKYKCINGDEDISFLPKQTTRAIPNGDKVSDCIGNAYAKHGWISVWLAVQSACLPETTVAIAAACVVKNF